MFKEYGLLTGFNLETPENKIVEEIHIWFRKETDL